MACRFDTITGVAGLDVVANVLSNAGPREVTAKELESANAARMSSEDRIVSGVEDDATGRSRNEDFALVENNVSLKNKIIVTGLKSFSPLCVLLELVFELVAQLSRVEDKVRRRN